MKKKNSSNSATKLY